MSERKSGRARKSVDYATFGTGDDLDDDFADSTPPASKKPRLSNRENKDKKSSKKVQEVKKEVKPNYSSNRKSQGDRRYERELQEALQLSLSQSDHSQESTGCPADMDQNEAPPIIIEDEDKGVPSPILPEIENPPVLQKMTEATDDIEVLETSIEEVPSSRRGSSKKKKYIESDSESGGEDFELDLRKFLSSPLTPKVKKKMDEDSDFAPEDDAEDSLDDDSDDGDDYNPEDSDSDFGPSKKKKSAKKTTSKSKSPNGGTKSAKSAKKSTAPAKSIAEKSVKTTKASTTVKPGLTHKPLACSSPTSRTPGAGLTTPRPPNWNPPGQSNGTKSPAVLNTKTNNLIGKSPIGVNTKTKPPLSGGVGKSPLGGVNIKSPSSGLRLGLSRNMKLKPLHPNLKAKN